jgi:two-component system OmpR family response regulator
VSEKTILVVEDDSTLQSVLAYNLTKEGYKVEQAFDGLQGLEKARSLKPDFMILDVMLPKMNGFEICRILRPELSAPILILTAKDDEIDKVVGLDLGADDYLTKPFKMRELLARIREVLRRADPVTGKSIVSNNLVKADDIEIDIAKHSVTARGNLLELTPKEFDLLTFFARNIGMVFNREQILEKVWGYGYAGDTRTVDVHVRWLREKIETNPDQPIHLITLRGVGYKFELSV